jgi:hypothetical protein
MRTKLMVLMGLLALLALVAACGDDDDDDHAATTDHAAVLAALNTLEVANLHHVEATLIGEDPAIDPAWLGPIVHARTATALIQWPEELHEAAESFLEHSMPLVMALEADDLEAASEAAPAAHEAWHLLKDPGFAYLAEVSGTEAASDGHADHDD